MSLARIDSNRRAALAASRGEPPHPVVLALVAAGIAAAGTLSTLVSIAAMR